MLARLSRPSRLDRSLARGSSESDDTVCGRLLGDALALPGVSGRVAWSTASHWLDRALDHDPDAFDAAFAQHVARLPLYRALTSTFARPATTYRVVLSLAPELAPVELHHLELSRGTLSLELRLRPHVRGCEGLFRAWLGIVRGLPRLHGRADAHVVSEISETRGSYEAELGVGATVARRSARASGCELLEALAELDLSTRGAVLAQILRSLEEAPDRHSSLRLLQERLSITRSEARVAACLADGKVVPDIARELGMADATVRTHLRNIFRKTGATRQVELVALVHRAISRRTGVGALRLRTG